MALERSMTTISLTELPALSARMKKNAARFVQILCVQGDECFDIIYTWMENSVLCDYKIEKLTQNDPIPSITDNFLAAFVFENEAHDLFGAHIANIAIDFQGHFYALSMETPMAVLSPEKKAEREKAAKIAAAQAAKNKAAAEGSSATDDLEAKLAGMDPEKAAKVRAAMEAKAAKEKAQAAAEADAALEAKLAGMDPEKAAKVRAAMEAKKAAAAKAASNAGEGE